MKNSMHSRANLKSERIARKLTQQSMADKLGLTLRHYQRIESGESTGSFEIWDALEDFLGIHQRILREILDRHLSQKENLLAHPKNQQEEPM